MTYRLPVKVLTNLLQATCSRLNFVALSDINQSEIEYEHIINCFLICRYFAKVRRCVIMSRTTKSCSAPFSFVKWCPSISAGQWTCPLLQTDTFHHCDRNSKCAIAPAIFAPVSLFTDQRRDVGWRSQQPRGLQNERPDRRGRHAVSSTETPGPGSPAPPIDHRQVPLRPLQPNK